MNNRLVPAIGFAPSPQGGNWHVRLPGERTDSCVCSAGTWTRLIDLAIFGRASGIFASVFFDD